MDSGTCEDPEASGVEGASPVTPGDSKARSFMSLIHVYTARDTSDAMLVEGLLSSEGLHPTVPGGELNDEFGASQRLAGTLGTEVYVPESEAEKAREIVAAWQERSASS